MSTKKTTTPKAPKAAAPKKSKKLMPIAQYMEQLEEEGEEEEGTGKIAMILKLFVKGYTRKEIIEAGYNKTTVYRQTNELKKLQKAPAVEYYGYDLYEARVQRLMKAKGVSHEKAIEIITAKDLES